MITETDFHPLTVSVLTMIQSAHKTITDENQPLRSRRLGLLMFEAMDDALARYHNDFNLDQVRADIEQHAATIDELPELLTFAKVFNLSRV